MLFILKLLCMAQLAKTIYLKLLTVKLDFMKFTEKKRRGGEGEQEGEREGEEREEGRKNSIFSMLI